MVHEIHIDVSRSDHTCTFLLKQLQFIAIYGQIYFMDGITKSSLTTEVSRCNVFK